VDTQLANLGSESEAIEVAVISAPCNFNGSEAQQSRNEVVSRDEGCLIVRRSFRLCCAFHSCNATNPHHRPGPP